MAKQGRGVAQSKFAMSFNSSDIAAYEHESPIPVLKQAYLDYERNKRKAAMRRAITSKKQVELQDAAYAASADRE